MVILHKSRASSCSAARLLQDLRRCRGPLVLAGGSLEQGRTVSAPDAAVGNSDVTGQARACTVLLSMTEGQSCHQLVLCSLPAANPSLRPSNVARRQMLAMQNLDSPSCMYRTCRMAPAPVMLVMMVLMIQQERPQLWLVGSPLQEQLSLMKSHRCHLLHKLCQQALQQQRSAHTTSFSVTNCTCYDVCQSCRCHAIASV